MNGSPAVYALLAILGGILIPITAALSGAMGRALGDPTPAALITVGGAFALVLTYALATGGVSIPFAVVRHLPALQLLAGFGIAFYIVSITYVAPRFGVGNAIMLVVAAQIASSAAIDQFGLFGAPQKPIDALRASGLAIMVVGVVIAQYAAAHPRPTPH
jgi:transporter family-2 protein